MLLPKNKIYNICTLNVTCSFCFSNSVCESENAMLRKNGQKVINLGSYTNFRGMKIVSSLHIFELTLSSMEIGDQ